MRLASVASNFKTACLERPRAGIPERADVAVIGAGVIGLSIGWRLARRGLSVTVFDRAEVGAGASLAAAGMLAAAAEHEPGFHEFLGLALESQREWPRFRQQLESEAALSIDWRECGTLVVALGRDELERLRFRHDLHARCGLTTRWLTGVDVRAMEPALRPAISAGLFCPDDHQVDPHATMAALRKVFVESGGHLIEHCPVDAVDLAGGRVCGVATEAGCCRAAIVIAAAGAWTGELMPTGLVLPVRPLKGQSLALRSTPETGSLAHIVWTEQVYLAPKGDGRLVVGATVEERGFDELVTAGAVYTLLEGARRALPSIEEMPIDAIWSGLRPSSIDDAPILGPTAVPGLVIATGHHRNGYLLAPATAFAIEALIFEGAMPAAAEAFSLDRFGAGPQMPSGQSQFAVGMAT